MEENSEIQIETDVSASSGNVSETQQMSGSHGDVEMVIVVEKVKEEAEGSSDNKLPEFKISDSESYQCSKDSSKKDIPTQKCVSSPNDEAQIKDISHENNTQKTVASPCKDTVITEEKQTDQLQKTISSPNKDLNQKKQTSKTITSDKKETQITDVSKANPPEKIINKELNQKILVEKKSTPVCKDIQIIDISLKNQNQKIVVSPSKSIQIIDVKGQTSKIIISPTKDVNQKNKTQKLVISPIKDAKTQEHEIEKNDRISNNPPITSLNIQNATETIEHKKTDLNSEEKPAVEIDSSTSITPQTDSNLTPTQEAVVDAETNNDKPENPNINDDKKEEIIFNTSIDVCEKSNDSQTNSDITEKEHNKSISRELKSLIKSAKESKIISECTQLTSKTRKSRIILDSSNISLNSSVEADKIQGIRRSSNNSQKSNCSEKSEKAPKRSMRSQNPEFVNKVKQFLNSVTGKFQKGESDDEIDENKKETHSGSMSPSPKKKKLEVPQPEMSPGQNKLRSDSYCWRCHWAVEQSNEKGHSPMQCTVCPRSFHYKCLSGNERSKIISDKSWVCPECLAVLHAESSETRSPAMKKISLGLLCELLQHALERMMDLNGVEPFINPVDRLAFPDYDKYVVHPMDLTLMKNNIAEGLYGSTEAFLADAQWILHNSIIFNTLQSKLTGGARALVRSCRAEMGEIEACPECYAAAHARRPTWFTDVCSTPHVLLWAKLKGFPYWPAKGMSVSSAGLVDVRFFGAHDRAWVPARDCFLYCEKDPNNFRTKRQDILDSMQEAEQHIRNISRKYGKFLYPPFKTPFDPTKLTEQLKMMIPTFEGELRSPVKEKSNSSPNPAKEKRRSNSKSSKGSVNEGDISETDEPQATTSRKMADGAEIAREEGEDDYCIEKDKSMEIDVCLPKEKETSRKRRRSDLEEAVITIIESSNSEKRKKVEIDKIDDKLDPVSSNKTEKNQVDLTKTEEDKTIETPTDKVEVVLSLSKNNVKESTTSTIEKESPAEKTPAKINIKIKPTRTSTPREKDEKQLTPKQRPVRSEKSTPVEKEKQETKAQKRRNSKNKSFNNSQTGKIEREKAADKKSDKDNSNTKDKSKDIIITRVKGSETDKSSEKPNKSNVTSDSSKSTKEPSHFDDNTTLAVIAREGSKTTIPGLPTISSVRSLSTTQNSDSSNKAATNNKNTETVTANSDSSIFIPTSTDNVRNMKEAVNKLQKLRNEAEPPLVGRVGVRAFARMTSPPEKQTNNKPTESVEVEIKSEPIDFDDADRQSEKLDLMNSFHLRPVNPPSSGLRGVRINKVVVAPIARKSTASKPAEARVKAKKTFPQPKKVDDGRSELNSKNSMVYIPIQPPSTQAPVRPTRPITLNGTANTQAIRPQVSTVTSNVNSIVNTVTTPLIPLTSSHSNLISTSTVAANTTNTICVPTVGQIPTTVHTVPLITSVNGQWTFSLQPVMSVGGLDGTASPPVVNGLADRNNSGTVTPLATASASQPAPTLNASTQSTQPTQPSVSTTTNESTPGEPPRLQQRPPLLNPLDSNTPIGSVPPPSTAGPLTAKLNQNAVKLADFFRNLLEDSLEKVDEPTSQATILKLQLEQMQWRYQQEIKELKHNHDLTVTEMRASFEKEKSRAISEARRTAQVELETAVKAAKSKQWCANCSQEALFYCCWNTSYCDYPCQRAHWSQHYAVCTQQKNQENNGNDTGNLLEKRLQPAPDNLPALQKSSQTPALTVGGKIAHTRVYAQDTQSQKTSIIVSMVEDQSGNQTVKCLGTYKPTGAQVSPLIINKQIMNNEENASKKVVTSGGYLIVGAGSGNQPLVTPSRRTHTIQYYT
ncbi:protein kinase C-binding protein 1-like isoform X1 [Vanessa cardui]|uniref:protein kinase C-binding protein 1-like isoform X1 n=1 Tax=Vanessa cardui TaxID=171605 RepID=UPI001F13674D|nr:protein kinase C-binding protein 1-like isoform X1 [Vanessa cardui]